MSRSKADPVSIHPKRPGDAAVELLLEAGIVLATSLDPATTMGQVARLTVPRLADLCVIDLLDQDGTIRDVAVAAADAEIARGLEQLRAVHRLDPRGGHPVARVIRSGQPMLLREMTSTMLRSFAQGSEHAKFMIERGYRSAAVAPLLARERTLGAMSVLRLGDSEPYRDEDMQLVGELARRAALAIDNARLFSELSRVEHRLQAVLVNLAEAITVVDANGQTVFANQAAADLLGARTPEELTSAKPGSVMRRFLVTDERGRELDLDAMPGRKLFAGEQADPLLVRNVVRATGEERWLIVRSSPVPDPDSGRIEYAVNVFENITEVKRVQLAESFMAEASRVLASSMDYAETLRQVARLAVPRLADWCGVDVVDDRGRIVRVAVHHADPQKVAIAERLDRSYLRTLDEPTGVAEVIRKGRAKIYTDIQPDALASYAHDDEHLQLLRAIGAKAVIIVPMIGASGMIGAITLVSAESLRRLSQADLALAERLARSAGTAVERARLYTERSRIAHTLERSLLPESLPQVPGMEICTRYSPAGELNEVGGDFYDVFAYDAERWIVAIGDVCGKGPRAAGVTALARHTLRAAALSGQQPTDMLRTLDRALRMHPRGTDMSGTDMCTVCLVLVAPHVAAPDRQTQSKRTGPGRRCAEPMQPSQSRLTVILAGHLPPLLIDPDGTTRPLGEPGTLLGVVEPLEIVACEAQMQSGQTLLLYTDGVPDAGRTGGQLGEQGLRELCAAAPSLTLSGLLEHIERDALGRAGGRLRDDIALVGMRLR